MATGVKSSLAGVAGKGTAAARKKRLRKIGRRVLYGAMGVFGILVVVFFLLPVWISNEQGRVYALQQMNKHMKAKLEVEDWSVGWFHGTELKNVTITLPDGTRLLSCPHIKSELTLWGILWGNYDVGTTPIETLQVNVTKYGDGTTSLDALKGADGEGGGVLGILRTMRGSVQVGSAVVTVNSVRAGQSLTYTDVKAALTIASPDAPFHLQVSAAAPDRTFSLSATLPGVKVWPTSLAELAGSSVDGELSASNLPTGLVCDFLGANTEWTGSLGETLENVELTNHAEVTGAGSVPSVNVRGNLGAVKMRMLWRGAGELSLPLPQLGGDYGMAASLRVSRPLVRALSYLNPVFAELRHSDGPVRMEVGAFEMSSGKVLGAGRIVFPGMTLERAGTFAQLSGKSGGTVNVMATPLKVKLERGIFSYDNFGLTVNGREKMMFSGATTVGGDYHLLATVPVAGGAGSVLGSGTADVPVVGTVDSPVVEVRGEKPGAGSQ